MTDKNDEISDEKFVSSKKDDIVGLMAKAMDARMRRREYYRLYSKARRLAHIEEYTQRSLAHYYNKRYGTTKQEIAKIFEGQGYKCAICAVSLREALPRKGMRMDSCRHTGKTRAGLCPKCISGLSSFCGEPEKLRAAAAYIESWRIKHAEVPQ
jgi:hypothetical protein